MFQSFADEFYRNFIFEQRWRYLSNGLLLTLEITFFAVLLGVLLGFSVALVRAGAPESFGCSALSAVSI